MTARRVLRQGDVVWQPDEWSATRSRMAAFVRLVNETHNLDFVDYPSLSLGDRDLEAVETLAVTGSAVPLEAYQRMHDLFGGKVALASSSGGTDVCAAFVGSAPLVPIYAGEISCRFLGLAADAFGPDGERLTNETGELVVTEPMPSMPTGLWGDDGARYRETYFSKYPGAWCHGDWVKFSDRGSCVILGRSDATLNRGGVRTGTSDYYHALETLPEVVDSIIVHLDPPDDRLILFIVLLPGTEFTPAVRQRIAVQIRRAISPRHVPDEIHPVEAIPRTFTGRRMEVPLKLALSGESGSELDAEVPLIRSLRSVIEALSHVSSFRRDLRREPRESVGHRAQVRFCHHSCYSNVELRNPGLAERLDLSNHRVARGHGAPPGVEVHDDVRLDVDPLLIASCLIEKLSQAWEGRSDVARGRLEGAPCLPHPGDATEDGIHGRPSDDDGQWLLYWLWREPVRRKRVVLALERLAAFEERPDDFDVLVEDRPPSTEWNTKGLELVCHPSRRHPEDEAASGEVVECGDLLGDDERRAIGEYQHRGLETQGCRRCGQPREDGHRFERVLGCIERKVSARIDAPHLPRVQQVVTDNYPLKAKIFDLCGDANEGVWSCQGAGPRDRTTKSQRGLLTMWTQRQPRR